MASEIRPILQESTSGVTLPLDFLVRELRGLRRELERITRPKVPTMRPAPHAKELEERSAS